MTRRTPWAPDDEKRPRDCSITSAKDFGVLSSCFGGKYSANAVYKEPLDLGLLSKEEEVVKKCSSSTKLKATPQGFTTHHLLAS